MTTSAVFLAAVELITVHMIDGRVVQINPNQITQLWSGKPPDANVVIHEDVKCVIRFVDGTHTSVAEDCETVRKLIEGVP